MAEEQLFYRFRKLKHIFEHNELESQEIYFAHFTELNDPMEAYNNIVFSANKIIWNKFIQLYFKFLNNSYVYEVHRISFFKNNNYSIPNEKIYIFFYRLYKKYLKNNFVSLLSNNIYNINQIKLIFTNFHIIFSLIMIYEFKDILNKSLQIDITNNELQNILNRFLQSTNLSSDYNLISYLEKFFSKHYKDKYLNIFLYTIDNFFNVLLKSTMSYFSIACFNKNQNNTLMWSHYSENHTGVCLIFSLKKQQIELEGYCNHTFVSIPIFLEKKIKTYPLKKIKYQKIKNNVNFFDIVDYKIFDFIHEYDFNIQNKNYDNMTYRAYNKYISSLHNIWTKDPKWKYEKEYRIVIQDINFYNIFLNNGNVEDIMSTPKYKYHFKNLYGIIFGLKTPISKRIQIINIIKNKCIKENRTDFKFYEMQIDETTGELKQVEININLFDTPPTEQNNE